MKTNYKIKFIIVTILAVFFTIKFITQAEAINRINKEITFKEEEINNLKDENSILKAGLEKVLTNKEYMEILARQRLGLIKDGEKIVIFNKDN